MVDLDEIEKEVISFWNLILMISNFVNLLANLVIFINEISITFQIEEIEFLIKALTGLGAFFSWLNLMDVLGDYEGMRIVKATFMNSAPSIFYFVIGVCPVFFGYMFMGLCMYNETERFANIMNAYVTLGAYWTGQSMQGLFMDLFKINGYFSFFFCLSWLFIICHGASNIIIFLLDCGYQEEIRAIEKSHEMQEKK
jgi:hypothetical protein